MVSPEVDVPVRFADRAVFLPDADALVLADVHLGRGVASTVEAPIDAAEAVVDRLESLLDRFEPREVVVAGDLLHSFSRLPLTVRRTVDALAAAVDDANADLIVVAGNHDTMLETVADDSASGFTLDEDSPGTGYPQADGTSRTANLLADDTPRAEYELADGETVVCHGHVRPKTAARRYLIGHDHPALSVEGRKYPCFLYGPGVFDRAEPGSSARDTDEADGGAADVLVLPAFSKLARGTAVNRQRSQDFQSPLITDADTFHPVIRDVEAGETLWFPPLGDCRHLL